MHKVNFTTKDSGRREQFTSGMVRDTQEGKPNFALTYSGPMLERWAALLTRGAVKYEKNNWMKASGQPELERFHESAARHFAQWMRGETDEDHAAAVYFNLNGAEYVKERLKEEGDCEAIARWGLKGLYATWLDGVGEDEDLETEPPIVATQETGPTVAQGDGDDGGSPFTNEEECKDWVRLLGCVCRRCAFKYDYEQGLISSTPVQVLNRADRPVDNL